LGQTAPEEALSPARNILLGPPRSIPSLHPGLEEQVQRWSIILSRPLTVNLYTQFEHWPFGKAQARRRRRALDGLWEVVLATPPTVP
jgi:hypothetical protein